MKHVCFSLLFLLLCSTADAEGVWRVKGHAFSNVHAWQKGTDVRVSGRVSGGPARAPFQAVVHVQSDEGKTHRVTIRKKTFSGQGETFEGGFRAPKRSRWWQIIQIEVVGADPAEIERQAAQSRTTPHVAAPYPPAPADMPESGPPQCFPLEMKTSGEVSSVLFSSMRPVCVTVRNRTSGRLVLMKNVSPHDLENTSLPCGEYSVKIVGDGFVSQKDVSISGQSQVIDLN
ncbi:MAG: hypothetical protein RBR38_07885 [Desulfomicrobium apsheronum]|nr:hypothetical protein [Desulfomicrobium apsheronum]